MIELRAYLTAFRDGQLAALARQPLDTTQSEGWQDGWKHEDDMQHWRLVRKGREAAKTATNAKQANSACKYL
jgi:hypothetical protein